jgi:hypothetical protein
MPLLINVGLNRKASKDFQSVGVSLNMTAELDQGLLSDPPRLQSEVQRIYSLAEDALERQISTMSAEPAPKQDASAKATTTGVPMTAGQPQLGHANGASNGNGQPKPSHSRGRPATESQLRALRSIARRLGIDLQQEAYHEFAVASPEDLSITAASQLIDALKERAEAAAARGRMR